MAYETIRRLGRGGMGVVDLARDDDGREVALKRLSLHGTPEELEKARQRIRREAEVLQQLDHPAIVDLLDVFDDGDDLVLVMDYLPGGNLAQRVNGEGPLDGEAIRRMGDRLLDGLAAAHRQGVVHRDIKPANVLFDADGNALLADFGAAIHRDATPGLTASEMVVGTPGFMSPEQARGETATTASDVFALGATLAFAATGEGPFGTADPRVLMLRAAAGRTEKLPRTLPVDLRRRLTAMLDRDPERRPSAAAARGGPDGTHPRTAARLPRVVARGKAGRIAAGAVVAVLLVGAVIAVLTGNDGGGGPLASPTTKAPAATSSTTAPCKDLPYRPCGGTDAPNTDGRRCTGRTADYDEDPENGCEAEPDGHSSQTPLRSELRGNIVPADDVDEYPMPVGDGYQLLCDGKVRVELTAPRGASQKLTVLDDDGEELGQASSADGLPGTVTLGDPRCVRDDATTLTVRVEAVDGSAPSAGSYQLVKSGSY
ncbi:serine/threonine protein kinase [Aquihabitans sp. G128]|uniref:serine/threonine-protein kinase n=1 Tax=Aquihabitans sp. G128 TaxID=2849779 RepID=UPI001C21022F|nr:serine/threonine-protein kinase [Aquihabitans sp. G128]QXC61475.1 serine/threonine protein kinase [Aquihabitans sp. G128]